MGVDADDAVESPSNIFDDLGKEGCERASIGIAEAEDVGAGVFGGFESAESEVAIVDVAVEEVLGVVDHFFAVVLQVTDRLGDDGEVFVFGDAEGAGNVEVPTLAEDGDARGSGIDQLTDVPVFLDGVLRKARRTKRRELCMLQLQAARLFEEL